MASLKVYFATNRNQTGPDEKPGFGDRFHADGPQFYRVGEAEVARVSDDPDEGYRVERVTLAPESKVGEPAALGSSKIFLELQQRMGADAKDVLIYLHGFANDFHSALARAAQLSQAYTITRPNGETYEPYVFAFSWPSNGRVTPPWHYFSDRDDAEASGKAMARALLRLVDFLDRVRASGQRCDQRLHLVSHSMGNWALRHAMQGLRTLKGDDALVPIFDNALLMAADEDDDTLEPDKPHKLGLLTRLARRISVYHSGDDGALVISDKTKFNPDRLGYNGPRSFSGLSTRITAIDCALVDRTAFPHVNHQYYRLRREVISDVRAVLSGLERPERLPWRETVETGRRYRIRLMDPETRPPER